MCCLKAAASSGADACCRLDLSDLSGLLGLPEVLLCAEPMTGSLPCDITDLKD